MPSLRQICDREFKAENIGGQILALGVIVWLLVVIVAVGTVVYRVWWVAA